MICPSCGHQRESFVDEICLDCFEELALYNDEEIICSDYDAFSEAESMPSPEE